MIKIQQLQHHFGSHKVIHNFNLDISKGEIVTFIGKKWLRKVYFTQYHRWIYSSIIWTCHY